MTMTISRTQRREQALVTLAVVVAARPSAQLEVIPKSRSRHEQTA
jgi:hypothetical protein